MTSLSKLRSMNSSRVRCVSYRWLTNLAVGCVLIGHVLGCRQLDSPSPGIGPVGIRGRDGRNPNTAGVSGSGSALRSGIARWPVVDGGHGAGATLAFAQFSSSARRAAGVAARELASLDRLGPNGVVLFRAPPGFTATHLRQMLSADVYLPDRVLRESSSAAVLLCEEPFPLIAVKIREAGGGADIRSGNGLGDGSGLAVDFRHLLEKLGGAGPVMIAVPAAIPELMRDAQWEEVHGVLVSSGRPVTVVVGESDAFSSWEEEGVRYISVGELTRSQTSPDREDEGRFAGLLWSRVGAGLTPAFHVIRFDGIMGLNQIQRRDQQTVARLAGTLSATPVDNLSPITTVRLQNTTDQVLEFTAQWSFQHPDVDVLPRIMGFVLQPGERFEQQFRFEYDPDRGLKGTQPTLFLRTNAHIANGDVRPITLTVRPWTRVAGTIPRLQSQPVLDGISSDWAVPALALDQPGQVAGDPSAWGGSRDCFALVRLGWFEGSLWIGIRVFDDQVGGLELEAGVKESCSVHFYAEASAEISTVTVGADGSVDKDIGAGPITVEPSLAFKRYDDGYGLEMEVPGVLLRSDEKASDILYFETVLSDVDAAGDSPLHLVLSGRLNSEGEPVKELFGRFSGVPAPAPSETAGLRNVSEGGR